MDKPMQRIKPFGPAEFGRKMVARAWQSESKQEKDERAKVKNRIGVDNGIDPPRFLTAAQQAKRTARNKVLQRAEYQRRHFFILRNLE